MAGGNRLGPWNQGPRTGRGLGYCTGHDQPGWAADAPPRGGAGYGMGGGRGRGFGRGYGRGQGYGRGRRTWADDIPGSLPDDTSSLRAEVQGLREQLNQLIRRLAPDQDNND